jgi:hypothetical protein
VQLFEVVTCGNRLQQEPAGQREPRDKNIPLGHFSPLVSFLTPENKMGMTAKKKSRSAAGNRSQQSIAI